VLTAGQAHESRAAQTLLNGWQAKFVLGDRAYDGNPVRRAVAAIGAEAVIPPHPCRKHPAALDAVRYRSRHALENAFARLKQFRRLATRYDKTARSYAAQVAIACIVVWLKH
jgi:transposase